MGEKEKIFDILRKSYEIEINGYTFYSMTAKNSINSATKELFEKLANDEVEHQNYLKSIAKRIDSEGEKAFLISKKEHSMNDFISKVFTDRFFEQAKGATFEFGALSVGLTLETNAVNLFTQASKEADSKEVQDFYLFLADWEKEHFEALKNLYEQLKVQIFSDNRFAPF